ncbi:LacI family DNA-binding transcriptional regulator [Petrocella sp. FN5]|uniref:LacI family DNA-binding transcriptional regulator n=1 Tax=Petrocella sp. FN5 TaxID=3032002 RepID=UPI0023DC013E|nr:LacI family DNA-binding transcriptional regulator [Petrocella sp. FN5]MDF1618507.1 LacI family DNA-binding transcriptional regulator [Petrocella sp. FN5]
MNIYDIAKLAGVSHTTISRVINNKPGVKPETRDRIIRILDENAYIPNSFARGLANAGNKIIGIIVIDVRNNHHINTAFHIEEEFSKYGYMSIIGGCGLDNSKQEAYLRAMAGRNIDGLVLIGSRFQNDITKRCIQKYFNDKPVVIANGQLDLENVCGVVVDERKAVSNVVDYLVSKGHREIAFMNDYVTYSAHNKQEGFIDGIRKNHIMFNESYIRHIKTDHVNSQMETEKFLKRNQGVTAIIYSEDIMAVGGVKACKHLGLKIPEDINIIGFNNSIYADISTPKISSIDNRINDMGAYCTKALYAMLQGEKTERVYNIMPIFDMKESTN